jgi:alkyl sulfatase BDS1-like metallo-beta-lactamase superfamily hydrolase
MTDVTAEFFDDLARRGHEPLLGNASGTMRFDIANGKKTESWFVTIDKGDLTVSRSGGAADSTLVVSKALFDRLASGKASAVAEVLRGTLTIEGDWRLLVLFRRILAGPSAAKPRTTKLRTPARTGRGRR